MPSFKQFILLSTLLSSTSFVAAQCSLPNPLPQPTALPSITTLPDPFTFFNGTKLSSPSDWACRKAELLTLVQHYMYGYYPDHSKETVTATRSGTNLAITVTSNGKSGSFNAQIALPNPAPTAANPAPVVIAVGPIDNSAYTSSGVAVVTFNPPDVAADSNSPGGAFWKLYQGQDIGVLLAWGWGVHRILDGIASKVPEIDVKRVGATGCSRYGKAALAAGIFDERITVSLPMSSGLEGIAPWRYQFESQGANEKIDSITQAYPYWTNQNLKKFVGNVGRIPFDAHINAALVAPRAVIWDEGQSDYWTNPEGEAKITYVGAQKVFQYLGVPEKAGVAIRTGGHCEFSGYTNVKPFLLREFFGTATTRNYSSIAPWTTYAAAYPWLNSV